MTDERRYAAHSLVVLGVAVAVGGTIYLLLNWGFLPAMKAAAELPDEAGRTKGGPFVIPLIFAGVYGWLGGWIIEQRGLASRLINVALAAATSLAGWALSIGLLELPSSAKGMFVVYFAVATGSSLIRFRMQT